MGLWVYVYLEKDPMFNGVLYLHGSVYYTDVGGKIFNNTKVFIKVRLF